MREVERREERGKGRKMVRCMRKGGGGMGERWEERKKKGKQPEVPVTKDAKNINTGTWRYL